jgi:hypothetical protein
MVLDFFAPVLTFPEVPRFEYLVQVLTSEEVELRIRSFTAQRKGQSQ